MQKGLLISVLLFVTVYGFSADAKKMYVNAEKVNVMEKKSAFAKVIDYANYGDVAIVLKEDGKWTLIKSNDNSFNQGWILSSNLTKRKVAKGSSANAKEISLAGKGFSAEVEGVYTKSGNGNYDSVDRVERKSVSLNEVKNFIIEGNLTGADE